MKLLEDRIQKDGKVMPGDVLRIDSFLNHQMDIRLLTAMGEEIHRLFKEEKVDKILTVEASGIAIACTTAQAFDVPLLFAKKSKTNNIPDSVYSSAVRSYTHGTVCQVMVNKDYLQPGERVLLVDDFLATGAALYGLLDLVNQAGAVAVGAGIAVEKAFQSGGEELRKKGFRVESLARIASMSVEDGITFVP